jgi:hypothetical protein
VHPSISNFKDAQALLISVSEQTSHRAEVFPLAPEDDEFSEDIRQITVGRYRMWFTIKRRKVHVLDVSGAFHRTPHT